MLKVRLTSTARFPAIAAHWSKDELLDRATPELRATVKLGELTALFDALSQFGPMVEYEGATGQATMAYVAGSGGAISTGSTDMDYAPEHYSQAQLDELDRLTARWISDHARRAKTSKK